MRTPQYTLTARDVQAHAAQLCQHHLQLRDHGPKCTAGMLFTLLCYAAARIGSLAAACKALRAAPTYTALHDALLATLPSLDQLQRRVQRALQGDLPKALRRKRQPLAIDLHLIAYHGQPLHDAEGDLSLPGQGRHQSLPCLRHRLRHPQGLPLHRRPDHGLPRGGPGEGHPAACSVKRPKAACGRVTCYWIAVSGRSTSSVTSRRPAALS